MDSPTSPQGSGGPRHLAELVTRAAARTPDHPAIVDVTGDTTLTWADVDAATTAEAARLRAAGVGPGDRVAVRLANGAPFCVAVLGALRADAVAVPVGPIAVPRELDIVFADCAPAVVVASPDDADAAGCAASSGATLIGPPDLTARVVEGETVTHGVGGEDVALLVYTSGTTGTPRGVRLSHRALLANRAQAAELRPAPVTPVDRVLLSLPLFHVFGLAAGFLQVCWAGATAVLTERFDPEHTAEVLVAQRVSGVAGVPSMFRSLLDLPAADLRAATADLRMCTSGGAPLPARWLADFRAATGLWIFEGYGLTEGGPVITTNGVGGVAKPGSVGRALPGIELRLVDAEGRPIDTEDPDDDELDAVSDPSHDTGLVAVRGPNLFSGYWPDGAGGPDGDGWFRTADVGFLDADGDLHLVDRSSDLVIVNGFNVYPREVERVLAELDGVAEAAVVGVPDDRTGEAVKAVLVRAAGSGLTEEEVRAHCAVRLARFKTPSVIAFVEDLPRTPTGKVARRQLAQVSGEAS
ncbi:long-chain fatty acid--CoA ligase [Pseudonocardia petroleophila]|uniref:AMP-binding protein n=1 Tax=Pseudonocardia petroleophila TaxID=37331 RepID=A0A7G7MNQ2_9PSEU|nr:AMP-binding protein [Pseudonocardia petroleophila]QNG54413.1 AMP-binding protein [Pseudonocardia petroleophila]